MLPIGQYAEGGESHGRVDKPFLQYSILKEAQHMDGLVDSSMKLVFQSCFFFTRDLLTLSPRQYAQVGGVYGRVGRSFLHDSILKEVDHIEGSFDPSSKMVFESCFIYKKD